MIMNLFSMCLLSLVAKLVHGRRSIRMRYYILYYRQVATLKCVFRRILLPFLFISCYFFILYLVLCLMIYDGKAKFLLTYSSNENFKTWVLFPKLCIFPKSTPLFLKSSPSSIKLRKY